MIKNKGNLKEAISRLKNHASVSSINLKANEQDGILENSVFTIKDNFATKNFKTQASSKILDNFMPSYNAEIIRRIEKEGGQIIAKVHLDELGLGGTGQFSAYGPIIHPQDKSRIAGGSSSGSVSTFGKDISFSIGSDTGNSVRYPASINGIFGFKPSYGAISRYGLFSYSSSLDTVAYFSHNLNDTIELSKVLYGVDEKDMSSRKVSKPDIVEMKPTKIAFLKNTDSLDNYQKEEYMKLRNTLVNDKIEIVEYNLNQLLLDSIETVYKVISYSEASSNLSNLAGITFGKSAGGSNWKEIMHNSRSHLLGNMVQRRLTLGAYFLSGKNFNDIFTKSQKVRRLIVDEFNKVLNQCDILLYPASAIAPKIDDSIEKKWNESYLIHANLSGNPSLVIPWSKHENMPYGLAIDAGQYKDKELLSYSLYINKLIRSEYE